MRLDPKADILSVVKDFSKPIKTPIFTSKISVDKMLNHLADKIDGDRRLEYINLVKPTLEKPLFITQESINGAQRFRFFKTFIDEKDKVVKFLNVVEDKNGELIEITATPIKNTDLKNLLKGKVIWGGDTLSDLSTPQTAKQGSEADKAIISQNSAKDELKSLSKEYDVEQFLKDRENILAKGARYGKTRFSESRIEDNGGVGGWEYKRTPAGYDKNYNADFLITRADVAKIRGGKIDEQILGKLKQDLESSEYLGYEYKKTHKNNGADEYADEEFFKGAPVESKGGHSAAAAIEEQRFAGTGRDKNTIMYANPHVGAGLAGGTLNAKDENGNFDAEKFAKGFIYGLFGSKVTAATLKKTNPKLYDQIVKIAEGNASKEKISSFVNKLKQDELGKLLQKTVTNKDLSTKTKVEIIEAAKGRYAQAIKNEQTKKAIEASAQKGRDMTPIGRENLNAEIVEYLTNNRQNVAIDVLSPKIAQKLGFRYANVKRTISSDAVRHTINRHGKDSDLVKKSGQKPVAYDDIAKWAQYADEADVQAITKDNIKQDVLISGKQLSEHYYVVVESIRKKANELAFKTMYFEKGSLKNSEAFKDAQTLLRGYEPDANSFAPLKD